MTECAAIVLAAGGSTRLGQPKQLVRLAGETLLRRTVRLTLEAACSPVFVVLGENHERLAQELDGLDAVPIVNEQWRSGMASSLKTGLSFALKTRPELDAVMVLVCDQPRLSPALLQELLCVHASRRPAITASHYQETLGVPAIFARPIFSELLQLAGDQGARRILQSRRAEAARVDFPGGEVDLDTPEDLALLAL